MAASDVNRPSGSTSTQGYRHASPVRRHCARTFDLCFFCSILFLAYFLLIASITDDVERGNPYLGVIHVVLTYGWTFFAFCCEAVFYRYTLTTPGKKLFGLIVTDLGGNRLVPSQYTKRLVVTATVGCGLYLPVIGFFAQLHQYMHYRTAKTTTYDQGRYMVLETS